jgi:glycogen(starch) synthase
MRILHVTVEYPPIVHGGLGTAVGGLVKASAAGLEVRVLLVTDAPRVGYPDTIADLRQPDVAPAGARIICAPWAEAYQRARMLIATWQPDILHLHVFWLWPIVARLRGETGVPVVYTIHSLDRAEYELGHGPPECLTQWDTQAAAIIGADRVIALTRSEADLVGEYCPAAAPRIRVVGNGIDIPPTASTNFQREADPVVLFTGRFVDRKGVRELLAAIPAVLQAAPRTRFVLAGGHRHCTADEMDLWWRPKQLQGCPQMQFAGWLDSDQMAAWYRAADTRHRRATRRNMRSKSDGGGTPLSFSHFSGLDRRAAVRLARDLGEQRLESRAPAGSWIMAGEEGQAGSGPRSIEMRRCR